MICKMPMLNIGMMKIKLFNNYTRLKGGNIMTLKEQRVKFVEENTCCDTVLNVWHTDKCTEIECRAGGDLIMFRVYGDEKEGFSYTSR